MVSPARPRESRPLIALVVVAALAAAPLFLNPGFLNTRGGGDSPFLLFRLHQLYTSLSQGVFPVRWMPDAAFGLGYPFFNYYAALPLYIAAGFKALGASYVLALKLAHLAGFAAAAIGLYGWLRAARVNRAAAWLAAAAYTFAPFHMVNVYVRGDSLSEFWAFAIYPLCLWAALRLAHRPSIQRGLPLALAYAALILAHNISALIFSPFLGLYILFLAVSVQQSAISNQRSAFSSRQSAVSSQRSRSFQRGALLFIVCSSLFILLGLALSAFFWLPALRETEFAQLAAQTTGYFHYGSHFRGRDLVQLSPLFNYDIGGAEATPFAMGLSQTILIAIGLVAVAYRGLKNRLSPASHRPSAFLIHHSAFIVLSFFISTFMITRYSEPLWANIPLLPFVQFPWRFLSVQSVFASAIIGLILGSAADDERPAAGASSPAALFRLTAAALLSATALLTTLIGLRPDFIAVNDAEVNAERLQTYEYFTGNIGTTIRYEYLPKWTQPRPYASEEFVRRPSGVSLSALGGQADGERIAKHAASQTWIVTVYSSSASVAVPLLYWPGWEARADGQPLAVRPAEGLGWVAFDLPQGRHTVELKLGDTPTRRAAAILSMVAIAAAAVSAQPWKWRFSISPPALAWGGLSFVVLLSLALGGRWLNAQAPMPGAATMDFDQLGWLHSEAAPFFNGDRLLNYNYSSEEVNAGSTLGVSLLWEGSGRATFELELVSPAEYLLNLSPSPEVSARANGRASDLVGAALRVPDDLPMGVYLLRLKLTEAGINVPALTSSGRPRGAIYLRPIRVVRPPANGAQPQAAHPMTPAVSLLDAAATQTDSASATITLRWLAAARVPANYMLALRLRDEAGGGAELAALDVQPTGGVYPTSIWRAGEIVPDLYRLNLPLGLPPGDYPLTLTLYDAATLQAAGSVTTAVHLSKWSPPPGTAPLYRFDDALALHDVRLPDSVRAGDSLSFRARWTSLAALSQDLIARWSLVRPNGEMTASADLPLAAVPSSGWAAGALVMGRPTVNVPVTAPPGEYTVNAQLLDPAGGLLSPAVAVGRVTVRASDRTAALPPMQHESGAAFGPIALAGYEIALEGSTLRIVLHWQAASAPPADYKYFVHVFNPEDESIAAQADNFPAIPTSRWFEGEVANESVALSLDSLTRGALYNIGVGWYDPASGERLGSRVILNEGIVAP